ncbi:MAG TPA: universal stress protein [Solirubrobacteraceae bacterium]|nr:universal stress protein [Solirubrobacteraceae bacterium]
MFTNVLVGVDGRQGGRDAIALAKRLAAPEALMVLGHVCPILSGRGGGLAIPLERQDAEALLAREREATATQAELVTSVDPSVGGGLHWMAEHVSADLLVVGSSRRGLLGRVFVGDQTSHALNGAPCAVAIAPLGYASAAHPLGVIGIGYDGSAESDLALDAARELSAGSGARIKAMLVASLETLPAGRPIPAHWPEVVVRLLDDGKRRLASIAGVDGTVAYGWTGEELARFGRDVDLLIVGSRSFGPVGRLFHGSTSHYLARHSSCPLLVLPRSAARHSQTDQTVAQDREATAVEL